MTKCTRAMAPRPDLSLVTTFYFGELRNDRTLLFPPILRSEHASVAFVGRGSGETQFDFVKRRRYWRRVVLDSTDLDLQPQQILLPGGAALDRGHRMGAHGRGRAAAARPADAYPP